MSKPSQTSNNSMQTQQEQLSESLGLHLEVEHPLKGKFQLTLSEQVALKLTPWLITVLLGLATTAGGAWLWLNGMPHQAPSLPPVTETQPRQ
jgi:hypothetical protein